ncbi:MAG TPA: glycosyltransferase family 4 protein [Cyclobacteriaceae bacterium]|nr:glycosyltransferase family 4 protein [Cyclobacteriaceae bacterium]
MRPVLFIYLKAFSFTGGIEKFNRSFMKALHELSVDGLFDASAISAYDGFTDEKYFPRLRFTGVRGLRIVFVCIAFFRALKSEVFIVGHINLGVVGYFAKRVKPSLKLIVIVHGIEVWKEHTGYKRKVLEQADLILSVSDFTKNEITRYNRTVAHEKIRVFPNTLDPYFEFPANFDKPDYLLKRYGISKETPILLTVSRLAFSEKYKGYDNVIRSMFDLSKINKNLIYLLCGKADKSEKQRIGRLIEDNKIKGRVKLLGFIPDKELIDHYLLADVFVMQSKKEGFGIVFIEALACGRNVIAGSKDGSAEALMHGELGTLVHPDSVEELKVAVNNCLNGSKRDPLMLQRKVIAAFGFDKYKQRLSEQIGSSAPAHPDPKGGNRSRFSYRFGGLFAQRE